MDASSLEGNYLEEASVAARAEGGAAYIDRSGRGSVLQFKGANWLKTGARSATVQAEVGNTRIGIVSAVTDYSMSRVLNDLYYATSSTNRTKPTPRRWLRIPPGRSEEQC